MKMFCYGALVLSTFVYAGGAGSRTFTEQQKFWNAVSDGYIEGVEEIYKATPDKEKMELLNAKDVHNQGYTALHYAVADNQPSVVEFLLKHGANKDIENDNEDTPYSLIKKFSFNARKQLEELLAPSLIDPLLYAVQKGEVDTVEKLIKEYSEKNKSFEETEVNGFTSLARAVADGNVYIVKALLTTGKVALNKKFGLGKGTLLHIAVKRAEDADNKTRRDHYKKIIELLVKAGVDVIVTNKDEKTPYALATSADLGPYKVYLEGGNKLHWSVADDNPDLKSLETSLPGHHSDRAAITGRNPFLTALHYQRPKLVQLFFDVAAVQDKDNKGKNALFYIIDKKNNDAFDLIVKNAGREVLGTLLASPSKASEVPLVYAISTGKLQWVQKFYESIGNNIADISKSSLQAILELMKNSEVWRKSNFELAQAIFQLLIQRGFSIKTDGILYAAVETYDDLKKDPENARRFKTVVIDYLISHGVNPDQVITSEDISARVRAKQLNLSDEIFIVKDTSIAELIHNFGRYFAALHNSLHV